jgi:hypothetical protein
VETDSVELNNHQHGMPRPPSKPPDAGKSAALHPQRISPLRPPEMLDTILGAVALPQPEMMTAVILVTAKDSISGEWIRFNGFMSLLVLRVKWVINVLDIPLNLMDRMHKLVPFILHSNKGVHVSSSGQHTSSLLSHMLPNGHHLPSNLHAVNTIAIHVFTLIGGLVIFSIQVGQIQLCLHSTCVLGMMIQNSIGEYDVLRATSVLTCYKQNTAFHLIEGKLLYLPYGLDSLLTMVKDFKVLNVPHMLTYVIGKWAWHPLFPPLQGNYQLQQGVDEHSGKKKCASIFIHYVGTLKDMHDTKELSKHVVSVRGGNSSKLIKIGCWLKQHNNGINDFIMLAFLEETALDVLITDQYSEPSYVKRLKLEMLTAVANESNTCELLTELCEYAANVNIQIARKSIWVVEKMALQQYDVNVVVPLLQFHKVEKGYATSQALMFATMVLNSSAMVIPWDPGKFNMFLTRITYQCYLRNSPSIYRVLNLVYDRGKIWLKSIWVLLMLVFDRGKFWYLSIWAQIMSDFSSFNGLTIMCFSSELKGLLAARRVIETSLNLEDKVVLKGWVLIETWIMKWALTLGPNLRYREHDYISCCG